MGTDLGTEKIPTWQIVKKPPKTGNIAVRLPVGVLKKVNKIAKDNHVNKAYVVRKMIEFSLEHYKQIISNEPT